VGQLVTYRTALETSIANDFFSWITPGAALGAPAAVFIMGRRGVPWDTATIICFGKSMIGAALILLLTFLCLILGISPVLHPAFTILLLYASGVVSLVLGLPILAAVKKEQTVALLRLGKLRLHQVKSESKLKKRLLKLLEETTNTVNRLHQLLRTRGLGWAVLVAFIHLPYFVVYGAILVVLLVNFDAQVSTSLMGVATVYLGFIYVAPTPGASGLSEATAASFFGGFTGAQAAFWVVILFRLVTVYLHLLVGALYFFWVGGVKEIMETATTRGRE
jgi:uncharacterized membrane protein YbhN (UPF0104 family)